MCGYDAGDTRIHLPCAHAYHEACGAKWLSAYSKRCPTCKRDVC
jgi:E3 ubiquitin-protein ligase BIG BROTHER-like protein